MTNRKSVNALAGLTTLVAVAWLYLFCNPRPAPIDERPHVATGQVLAAEAAKHAQPGGRIIVIARVTKPFQVPAAEAQLKGLLDSLEKASLKISALRTIA